ncbi:MAG TPA: cupin domain-containing protein [Thermoanaerobaculia bacterium]|nr:cupin domain-containing protein [Thermoanaerobaculia bacterium]
MAADMPMATNVNQMKFGPTPGLPTCVTGALTKSDPGTGAFIAYAKIDAGCIVPWHWHNAAEHLMIVSGVAHMETMDAAPVDVSAGGFALVPSHHQHQASCPKGCTMYVYSDGAFDIHYVDKQGNDLTPEAALGALKETPGRPPQ